MVRRAFSAVVALLAASGVADQVSAETPRHQCHRHAGGREPGPSLRRCPHPARLRGQKARPPAPQWRTSFGSERRTEPARTKPATAVDADIVLLQGVTDVPLLRRWFPAGSGALSCRGRSIPPSPKPQPRSRQPRLPSLARGLRMTGQDHLLELADASGRGKGEVAAAGTAVRILIEGRQTWALSVLLPEKCGQECPGQDVHRKWSDARKAENVRHVTGGLFRTPTGSEPKCGLYGLMLEPAPPPPRQAIIAAVETPQLGCVASVSVAK